VLTDTHCHLDLEAFDADRVEVIDRAKNAGISRILIPGITVKSSRNAVKLSESHAMLYAAIGVHPNDVVTWDDQTISDLRHLVDRPSSSHPNKKKSKVVALGEIGLDYYWSPSMRKTQIDILRRQLSLALEFNLPVVLHSREKNDLDQGECSEDLLMILDEWVTGLKAQKASLVGRSGVLHSFSGSLETAHQAIKLGFFIGVTGPITFKNADHRRRIIEDLPLENILIETDAPFLPPVPYRGKRNEPAFVAHIADKIAEIKSFKPQEIADITTKNAERLFAWEEIV
jgi:TatD DNase family protein